MPLLAATVLILGAAPVRAETPVDRALDSVWSCVEDFALSLTRNSPLSIDAVTEQALGSCHAEFEGYRRTLMESPLGLSPDEIEVRLQLPQATAKPFVGVLWDKVRMEAAAEVRDQFQRQLEDRAQLQLGLRHEPDGGIWMNPGLTEAETAEARRSPLLLPVTVQPPRLP
jgi:hypothetical protein